MLNKQLYGQEQDYFLESIVSASTNVLQQYLGDNIQRCTEISSLSTRKSADIHVTIKFNGSATGYYLVSLDQKMAAHLAANMIGDIAIEELDKEDILSAIAELSNIVAGNAAIWLEQQKIVVDISPPTVSSIHKLDQEIEPNYQTALAQINTPIGTVNVGTSFKTNR